MTSAPAPVAPTAKSDPQRDRPAASTGPASRTAGLLVLLHKLVDYAKEFANTLHQRATAPDFHVVARRFGTANLALILARIANGLRLAGALEARLVQRAARENAAASAPIRPLAPRQRRAARPAASSADRADDELCARLPSAEEIAANLRRRPIGAVLADIARDFGIVPSHRLWRELCLEVGLHGGSFIRLWRDFVRAAFNRSEFGVGQQAVGPAESPEPYPQFLAPAGTRPP
jgi:hypothetical protein